MKDLETPQAESPGRHDLAIGYYIGALILFLGLVLVFTGLLGPERPAERRLGFDINLWWGLAMTAFGAGALLLNYLTRRYGARRKLAMRTPPST